MFHLTRVRASLGLLVMAALLVGIFSLSGCSSAPTKDQQTVIDVSVNIAVAVAIQNNSNDPIVWKDRARRTVAIAEQLAVVASADSATIPTVTAALVPLLDKADLSPPERIAANQLVVLLSAEIQRRVQPDEPTVVEIRHVIDLVKTAATAYL